MTNVDVSSALAVARRLNEIDMWAESMSVYVEIGEQNPLAFKGDPALEGAWTAFQHGDFDACRLFLTDATSGPQRVMMERGCAAITDGALFHAVVAEGQRKGANPVQSLLALHVAIRRADWTTAGALARVVLMTVPGNGTAWVALAVESALAGRYADAIGAVANARKDRFPTQSDPAAIVLDAVRAAAGDGAALTLTASGALLDPDPRPGWDGWAQRLSPARSRRPEPFEVWALTGGVGFVLCVLLYVYTLHGVGALGFGVLCAAAAVAGIAIGPLTSRAHRYAARARLVSAARHALKQVRGGLTSVPGPGSNSDFRADRCACHWTTVVTGNGAGAYLREHLNPAPNGKIGFGYATLTCPVTGRAFIQPDGLDFAVIAPEDGEAPGRPGASSAPSESGREAPTGQYL